MPATNNNHYVKFMRGSITAWENLLRTPEQISDDTLYFIYSKAENTREGKLYLGQKLISGSGSNEAGDINLSELEDVVISGTPLTSTQILIYNVQNSRWENASLNQIIVDNVGLMVGASASRAGHEGLVPAPSAGDQGKFLRADGQWAEPASSLTFDSQIFYREVNNISLSGYAEASPGSVLIKTASGITWVTPSIGTLRREISTIEELRQKIQNEEELDTNTIYMVSNGNPSDSDNYYDEYMYINNKLERIGGIAADLTNYTTKTYFDTHVGVLKDALYGPVIVDPDTQEQSRDESQGILQRVQVLELFHDYVGDFDDLEHTEAGSTLIEEVNYINEKLRWHELEEAE